MTALAALHAALDAVPQEPGRPGPRSLLDPAGWSALPGLLEAAPSAELLALWAEPTYVHAALRIDERIRLASVPIAAGGRYAALSPARPAAAWFERTIRDLWGHVADGAVDLRPWLDHGHWPRVPPMARTRQPNEAVPLPPSFLPVEGEGLHQIPVGPVHAGIIEPGHFRFTVQGETVVRLEIRLGYVHKGILALCEGKSPRAAVRFASRLSGDSAVAHSWAFSAAAEAAAGVVPPPRAVRLRGVLAELERIANHLGDWGAIANDATFPALQARTVYLREQVLRANELAFGHRLLFDRIVPGGIAADIGLGGIDAIRAAFGCIEDELPALVRAWRDTSSLADRMIGTGTVRPALVQRFAAGGFVGRASGRAFDARSFLAYEPYDLAVPAVPVFLEGDVDARVRVRIAELEESMRLVRRLLEGLPDTPVVAPWPAEPDGEEGWAMIEGFRGECFAWMRLTDAGLIDRIVMRDPSWLQWPLLEAAIEGNIVADFPLCNKSFNASYAGCDL